MSEQTDQIFVHLDYIRKAVDGTNARLDLQNGRVRDVELAVVVLRWAMGIIGAVTLACVMATAYAIASRLGG